MFRCISMCFLLPLVWATVLAQPKLPETAKQLDGNQIKSLLANRTFKFVVHDAGVAAHGDSTWDPQSETAFGDYVWGPDWGKWKRQWKVMGNKNCTRDGSFGKWECQNIFVDGSIHYEVRDDGVIHSINTPVAK
jgi:hypothetical protein